MIRFDLKLLPVEGASPAEVAEIESANELATLSYRHLKRLIGRKRCRKHPSSPNKLRVFAEVGSKYPRVEVVNYCCPKFIKSLR